MDNKTIIIAGEKFEISAPYTEGHTLTAAEARVLNQTRAENIGNNLRKRVKEAQEKGDLSGLPALIAEADANYSFSMPGQGGGSRIVDPVEREARKLATETIRARLKDAYGITLKGIHPDYKDLPEAEAKAASAERFESAIETAAARDDILALAKKNVANRKKATDAALESLGI